VIASATLGKLQSANTTLDPRNSDGESDQRSTLPPEMDGPPAFGICEPFTPCTFKDRASFPQSNGGRTLRSDLTAEIYPPLQRALLVFIQI
jgi:hypothetical protein